MKKMIAIVLVIGCMLVFFACNGCGGSGGDNEQPTAAATEDLSTRNPEANEGGEDTETAAPAEGEQAETPATVEDAPVADPVDQG